MYYEAFRNFTIDPDTGVLRIVGELDREAMDPELKGIIELNVTATDKGAPPLSTAVTVTIVVEDVDDNTPVFKDSSYKLNVKEGEKGVFVGSVQAEDMDQEFDRISFSILEGSFGSFIIRSYEDERGGGYLGNITVDPDIELDYESENKVFTLKVEAADLGQHSSEVTVKVFVLDVNDERPVFEPPTVTVTVKEDIAPGSLVGRFTAKDRDGNHSLVYRLESLQCRCNGSIEACGGFVLEPTGEVRLDLEHTLDYDQCDQVWMEAQVVDEYTEKGENNSATAGLMEINIEDVNDNAPQFIVSDSVFVVVSERASKGMPVARVTVSTDMMSEWEE
ncbi:Cadherin-related family member 2 [Liparis tanakae]|uniref:Cadherin-related family member 2 n=1 Tax=Liparis tanakae TaxID=230148 RepID=A0A4Z2FIX8_9TELE|nr:Cadherin-related family member 2 [Liparis tanakae]